MMQTNPTPYFDRWGPRVLVAAIVAAPLVMWLYLEDAFDLPKLTLLYLVDLVLIALWIAQARSRGRITVRRMVLGGPLLASLAVLAITGWYSMDRSVSLFGTYRIYSFGCLPLFAIALLYVLTTQLASHDLQHRIEKAAFIAGALAGLYAILQFTGWEIFERMPRAEGGRVWSSLGNPIYLGALCMMALPISLNEILRSSTSRTLFVIQVLGLFCLIGGIALSLTRGAWVGTAIVCLFVAYAHHWNRPTKIVLGICAAAVLLAGIGLPQLRERASVLLSAQEASNAARIAGWKGGISIWLRHPGLGTGPDTFLEAFRPYRTIEYIRAASTSVTQADAHNDFIQAAATLGTLGLGVYIWLWVAFWRNGKPRFYADPLRAGLAAALLGLFVQNQFNFSTMATSIWAAVFAGLIAGPANSGREIELSGVMRRGLILMYIPILYGVWAAFIPVRADAAFKEGEGWAQQADYLRALQNYQEAVRLQGRNEAYHTELANNLRTLGQLTPDGPEREHYFDQAWGVADAMVNQHPYDPDTWNNRGVVAMWLVQLAHRETLRDVAHASFMNAVRIDPVFIDAWANLARWEHLAGHLDEEKTLWQKVLTIDPHHEMAQRVLAVHP
jgi:tetratricopeptide (TPR) repeat protein